MGIRTFAATAAVLLTAALAACGGSHPAAGQASFPQPLTSTPASAALACGTVLAGGSTASSVISGLVQDQDAQNKAVQEGWVGVLDGILTRQGQDLQKAVNDFAPYATGAGPLSAAAVVFGTGVAKFLSDQAGGLQPGWPAEAGQIEQDIHVLAAACGIPMTIPSGCTV